MIKLGILRWRHYPGFTKWAPKMQSQGPLKREAEGVLTHDKREKVM